MTQLKFRLATASSYVTRQKNNNKKTRANLNVVLKFNKGESMAKMYYFFFVLLPKQSLMSKLRLNPEILPLSKDDNGSRVMGEPVFLHMEKAKSQSIS